jgi:hypothetical protein
MEEAGLLGLVVAASLTGMALWGPKKYRPYDHNKGNPRPTDPVIKRLLDLDPDGWRKGSVEGTKFTSCFKYTTPRGAQVMVGNDYYGGSSGYKYDGMEVGGTSGHDLYALLIDGVEESASSWDVKYLYNHAYFSYWNGPTGQAEHRRNEEEAAEKAKRKKRDEEERQRSYEAERQREKAERKNRADSL